MERRLREIAAGHPPEIEKYLLSFVTQGETHLAAMLEETGYQPARYAFDMVRPDLENIPNTPVPEGLEARVYENMDRRMFFGARRSKNLRPGPMCGQAHRIAQSLVLPFITPPLVAV